MIAGLAEALRRLETSSIGEAVRMTPHLYPILESLHVLGIALLVGSAVAVDLRLLGIGRSVLPVTVVAGYLLPLARIGFGLAAVTGVTMFTGIAVSVAQQRGRAMEIRTHSVRRRERPCLPCRRLPRRGDLGPSCSDADTSESRRTRVSLYLDGCD